MESVHSVWLDATPPTVFVWVDDLGRYRQWMQLVHAVEPTGDEHGRPAWDVELRAQVGPLARSKRLRMVRTTHEPSVRVVFARDEIDGRQHAPWVLTAELAPSRSGTDLTMTLRYGGGLWTGVVLQRVLDDAVRQGSESLRQLLVN